MLLLLDIADRAVSSSPDENCRFQDVNVHDERTNAQVVAHPRYPS